MNCAKRQKNGVIIQESTKNIGGRPAKSAEERATVKLNCWVTGAQRKQLESDYMRVKAGAKLSFATYLKQKLLSKATVPRSKTDELLLTVLINLQDRGRQLDAISHKIEAGNGDVGVEINQLITEELTAIQVTLTNISTWLYES